MPGKILDSPKMKYPFQVSELQAENAELLDEGARKDAENARLKTEVSLRILSASNNGTS